MRGARRAPRCGRLSGWALGAAVALAATGCGRSAPPPNVLLVVLDTLRADRLAAYGSTRNLTPFLDEVAAQGVVFERAYAPSSWTSPTIASLFTSRHPLQHGVVAFESVLGPSEATLAESLSGLGFATGGFSANFRISQRLGYGQGFDTWRAYLGTSVGQEKGPKVPARYVRQQALAWLDGVWNPQSPRPVLLYVHFLEPHSPYDPPEALRRRFAPDASRAAIDTANDRLVGLRFGELSDDQIALLGALYDGEVAALDEELRTLFAALEARGFLEHAIVVVAADHGEEFGEHGQLLHGLTLFEESVRVPFVLRGAGLEAGRRVAQPVSLLDVAPTILALLGAPVPAGFEGRSLLPLLRGEVGSEAWGDVLLDLAAWGEVDVLHKHSRGLVRGSRKLLVDSQGRARIFDLSRDPAEVAAEEPRGEARDLMAALERERTTLGSRAGAAVPAVPLDPENAAELRALGYLPDSGPLPQTSGVDHP